MPSNPYSGAASTREGRRLLGADRREQILEEAMACFAEDGFKGTTVRALAARVGISEAALYRYYPSKEALYAALIDRKMATPDLVSRLQPVAERGDDLAFFSELAREITSRIEADPGFLRLLYFSALEGHQLATPFFESRVKRLREFLSDYIAAGIEDGRFVRIDPVLAARAFLGMVFDHMNVRLVLGQADAYPHPNEEVADTFAAIFVRGMQTRGAQSTGRGEGA